MFWSFSNQIISYEYVNDPNAWVDVFGLAKAPSSLPNTAGVYIITNGNDSYVGSAGIGKQGMNKRTSKNTHINAQDLLKKDGTTVDYIKINGLDNVKKGGERSAKGNRNIILRYYEQQALDAQMANGKNMKNGRKKDGSVSRILSPENMIAAEKLIKKQNITKGEKTSCS
jgi:hypothetical protein